MHRDLKAACAKPSTHDLNAQQMRLNHFVKKYNQLKSNRRI